MAIAAPPQQFHHHRPLAEAPATPLDWLSEKVESRDTAHSGAPAGEITAAVVRLLREYAGRGPTQAKTVLASDLAVVTLHDCLTEGEKTVADGGRRGLVSAGRDAIHEAIRPQAEAMVAAKTGCPVVAYLAYQGHDPDRAVIAFVLAHPADAEAVTESGR